MHSRKTKRAADEGFALMRQVSADLGLLGLGRIVSLDDSSTELLLKHATVADPLLKLAHI